MYVKMSVWLCDMCRHNSTAEQAVSAEGDIGLHQTGGVRVTGAGHLHHQCDATWTN